MTDQPKLPLTVPLALWETMARETYAAFADSYLSGAELSGATLRTKTFMAYSRIAGNGAALRVLRDLNIRLVKPDGTFDEHHRRETMSEQRQAVFRHRLAETLASLTKASAAQRSAKGLPPPPVQARTDDTGISPAMRALLAKPTP
jgi:hypothetical protein